MKIKQITSFNQNALINIDKYIDFSNELTEKPVYKNINYEDFESLGTDIITLLDAIECIGHNGNSIDMGTCAGLATLVKKLLPINALDFLDSLLINPKDKKIKFSEIKDLKT